jgi:DnaK suppressor protein
VRFVEQVQRRAAGLRISKVISRDDAKYAKRKPEVDTGPRRVVAIGRVTLSWSVSEQEVDLMDRATLLYFRGMLEEDLAQLSIRLESGLLSSESHNDDRDPKDEADLANSRSAQEWAYRMQGRNHRLRREIRAALQRIRDGEFGVCDQCADDIGIERLRANPWTRVCINCKRAQENFARRKVA